MIKPEDILKYRICVHFEEALPGGPNSTPTHIFEFTPEKANFVDEKRNWIKWGSWMANWWFSVPCTQSSVQKHLTAVKRKLQSSYRHTITVEKLENKK